MVKEKWWIDDEKYGGKNVKCHGKSLIDPALSSVYSLEIKKDLCIGYAF